MHNFQLPDFVKPVYAQTPEYDYVDQLSDVDKNTDIGTHSNFTAEKDKNLIYDTMTEANVPVISNDLEDFVDSSTSDVDKHAGHGTHSDFTKQQASDSQYDTLTEANTASNTLIQNNPSSVPAGTWTFPTLAYADAGGSAYTSTNGAQEQYGGYGFSISSSATITQVRVRLDAWSGTQEQIKLEVSSNGGSSFLVTTSTWTLAVTETTHWVDVTSWDTWTPAKLNNDNIRTRVTNVKVGAAGRDDLDWIPVEVTYNLPNYELDLEEQWTTADFDETTELLCIKTGTLNGEGLGVDVWNGGSWVNVIASLTASAWNNVSVTTWLTSATFTIRFLGGTESGDTTQSTWQIDATLLHTYTVTDNYRLDLEEQFTDAEYTRTYEELCIYMGTTDAEDIRVYVWITSNSSWVLLFNDLTANSWNNVSVTSYLIDSTFTIKFVDGTQSSDSVQSTWQKDCALLHTWSLGYNLNLRVRDWDLTDSISGALVYKDTDVLTSNSGGWANWTLVSGTVAVKVKYFGFWVNGTFSVTMDSDKTIDVKCKLYDVTITVQENAQSAYLVNANVSVYNASSTFGNRIKTGITGSNGQVSLTNLPNNTLTFTQYGKSDWSLVIGNTTQFVNTENQSITLTSNQNNLSTTDYRGLIGIVGFVIPLKRHSIKKCLKRKRKIERGEKEWRKQV